MLRLRGIEWPRVEGEERCEQTGEHLDSVTVPVMLPSPLGLAVS